MPSFAMRFAASVWAATALVQLTCPNNARLKYEIRRKTEQDYCWGIGIIPRSQKCENEVIRGGYERNQRESFLVAFGEARLIALKLTYLKIKD